MADVYAPLAGKFSVNIDAILKGASQLSSIIAREGPRIKIGLRNIARSELLDVTDEAVMVANQSGGFPEPFQLHLTRVMRRLPISTGALGMEVFASLDLDLLGTREDLHKAYHQGARLKDGGKLDGPYTGQPLANENARERHIFWEAFRRGDDKAENPKGPGMVPIPKDASWEQTMQKYIEIWGEQAPEWLLIQFGQNRWNPQVHQYDIVGEFGERFRNRATAYIFDILEEELRIINQYKATGIDVGFISNGSVVNKATGRFTKRVLE